MVLSREAHAFRQTSLVQRASVANFAGPVALAIARAYTATITGTATGHIATTPPMAIAPTAGTIARMGTAPSTATVVIIATGSKRSDLSSCRLGFARAGFFPLPCSLCRLSRNRVQFLTELYLGRPALAGTAEDSSGQSQNWQVPVSAQDRSRAYFALDDQP
jgi:hypothetical protein